MTERGDRAHARQSRIYRRATLVIAAVFVALLVPVPLLLNELGLGRHAIGLLPVYLLLVLGGRLTMRKAIAERKHNASRVAPDAQNVLESGRPHIVYLRSFLDEQRLLQRHFSTSYFDEEEGIAGALAPYGELVAIRDQKGSLPAIGASRMNASNDTWQEVVRHLVDTALFVIVRLGDSPGVLWELELVVRRLVPSRVILLSALSSKSHAAAAADLRDKFGIELPKRDVCVFTFDDNWAPTARNLLTWNLRADPRARHPEHRLQHALRSALVPFFLRLGLDSRLPPIAPRRVANFILVMFVLGAVFWGSSEMLASLVLAGFSWSFGALLLAAASGFTAFASAIFGVTLVVFSAMEVWFPEHLSTRRRRSRFGRWLGLS